MSDTETSEEDDGGIFCQSCSPTTRKCGYFLTFLVGLVGFVWGIIQSLTNEVWILIVSSIIILLCPLWIKSPKKCIMDFRNILRMSSALIFVIILVLNILCASMDWGNFWSVVLGILLAVSGVWYFLTFCPNGQKACIGCIKDCCGKGESA